MPILFGTLWKDAEKFSYELQKLGFEPLQGELRIWWIIFRNVQVDLQINASSINKAQYLTIQEWVILSKTYLTSKQYFETSVYDLIKQDVKATSSAYSAGEALSTGTNTKEKFLIGENVNENALNQGLINFINKLDVHFNNLARISPMAKLLKEYRNAIALVIPYYDVTTDVIAPTFGNPPIYTNPNGAIELIYDDAVFTLNSQGQLTILDSSGFRYEKPLNVKNINDVELLFTNPLGLDTNLNLTLNYNPDDFILNEQNKLSLSNTHKNIIDNVSIPLKITNKVLNLEYDESFAITPTNQLTTKAIMPLYVSQKDGPGKILPGLNLSYKPPLYLISMEEDPYEGLGLGYNQTDFKLDIHGGLSLWPQHYFAPLNHIRTETEDQYKLLIDPATLTINERNELSVINTGVNLTFNEPLRITNNTEVSLGYEAPLYETTESNLGIKIGSPLYLNPQNQLTLNYTPVFKLNTQQQLDLSLAKPLIFDSNHDLSLDYSGGLTLLNSKLQLNLSGSGGLVVDNRQELQLNINTVANAGSDNNFINLVNYNNIPSLSYDIIDFTTRSDVYGSQFLALETALKNKIITSFTNSTENKTKITTATNKIAELKTNLNTTKGELNLLNEQVTTNKASCDSHTKQLADLNITVSGLASTVTHLDTKVTNFKTELDTFNNTLTTLTNNIHTLVLKATAHEQELNNLEPRIKNIEETTQSGNIVMYAGREIFENAILSSYYKKEITIYNNQSLTYIPLNIKGNLYIETTSGSYKWSWRLDAMLDKENFTSGNTSYEARYVNAYSYQDTVYFVLVYLNCGKQSGTMEVFFPSKPFSDNINIYMDFELLESDTNFVVPDKHILADDYRIYKASLATFNSFANTYDIISKFNNENIRMYKLNFEYDNNGTWTNYNSAKIAFTLENLPNHNFNLTIGSTTFACSFSTTTTTWKLQHNNNTYATIKLRNINMELFIE